MTDVEQPLFERVDGVDFFVRLVDRFYAGVEADPVLLPLYPEAPDLTGARHRLTLFLAQYWGGPTTYSDERGHPRLRMRHTPFTVGPRQRDHWLAHMGAAVAATAPTAEIAETLGCSRGTVKSTAHRALKSLKAALGEADDPRGPAPEGREG